MKLHRNILEAVVASVEQIFNGNTFADRVIEKTLRSNPKWGARDRKLIAESVYEIVRWWRLYSAISGSDKADNKNIWDILGIHLLIQNYSLPEWIEFQHLERDSILLKLKESKKVRKIRESIPDWLDELCEKELGKKWDKEILALNIPAQVVIRVNEIKIQRDDLARLLLEEGIETTTIPELPSALVLKERKNLFTLSMFKDGFFEIQDAASQLVAQILNPEPGMRVIDACAGGGGKTLHIAVLMKNKGRIISLDTEKWKLDELMKRARRDGIGNIETRTIDSTKVIKRLKESADRLLLDVPCSGLGVLRRNPDAKWKLSFQRIEELKILQRDILFNYSQMLKPGGKMVYATCSILPSENREQIENFLKENSSTFELIEDRTVSPSDFGFDGFYIAVLKKKSI